MSRVLLTLIMVCFSQISFVLAKEAKKETKQVSTDEKNFDFKSYGQIEKGELGFSLKITQKGTDILAAVVFQNESKRDLNIYTGLWFTHLKITINDQTAEYKGPMASMPPPQKKDFKTVTPGGQYVTESVLLNSYYKIPHIPGAQVVVKYSFNYLGTAEASFTLK